MTQNIEKQLLRLIATDRIDRPISSMSGKLKRAKPGLARAIDLSEHGASFQGDRTYARIEESSRQSARGMREGIDYFKKEFPRYGKILDGMIEEARESHETHLYFGMNPDSRLTSADYMHVMSDLGFSGEAAKGMYTELMNASHKIAKSRKETERRILIG